MFPVVRGGSVRGHPKQEEQVGPGLGHGPSEVTRIPFTDDFNSYVFKHFFVRPLGAQQ